MVLNKLKEKVSEFEKKAGFDKTDSEKLIEMLQEELNILRKSSNDKNIADHELMDMQVLILQIANRLDTNLDLQWEKHFEKSKKYIK